MRNAWWIVWVGLAVTAQADEGWEGRWQVVGEEESRQVLRAEAGLALELDWPGEGRLRLEGSPQGAGLRLRAKPGAGLRQALQRAFGGEVRGPVVFELRATRVGDDAAEVSWLRDGQVRWREDWRRAGAPALETVTPPAWACDPQAQGPVGWRIRVLGQAQRLRLEVDLTGADRGRRAVYQRRRLETVELGVLPVGEHTVRWSGREPGPSQRVAMAGGYRLRLIGDADRLVAQTRVVAARAVLLDPAWPDRGPAQLDRVRGTLERGGYAVRRVGGQPRREQVFDDLRRAAVVWIRTHGNRDGFGLPRGDSAETFTSARLEALLAEDPDALRDLRAVLIYSCHVGANGGDQLPRALLAAGADCVAAFDSAVLTMQHTPWQHELSRWVQHGDSLRVASRKAAYYADLVRWSRRPAAWRQRQRARGVRPLRECLVFRVAPGIDPDAVSLLPARYGRRDR